MPTYILHTHTYTYCTVCVYIWSLAHHHIGPHLGTWTAKHCAIPGSTGESLGPLGYRFENQTWSKHPTAGMFSKKWVSNCSPEEILKFAKRVNWKLHYQLWWPPWPPKLSLMGYLFPPASHQLPRLFRRQLRHLINLAFLTLLLFRKNDYQKV